MVLVRGGHDLRHNLHVELILQYNHRKVFETKKTKEIRTLRRIVLEVLGFSNEVRQQSEKSLFVQLDRRQNLRHHSQ
jgi:hypothetical protein